MHYRVLIGTTPNCLRPQPPDGWISLQSFVTLYALYTLYTLPVHVGWQLNGGYGYGYGTSDARKLQSLLNRTAAYILAHFKLYICLELPHCRSSLPIATLYHCYTEMELFKPSVQTVCCRTSAFPMHCTESSSHLSMTSASRGTRNTPPAHPGSGDRTPAAQLSPYNSSQPKSSTHCSADALSTTSPTQHTNDVTHPSTTKHSLSGCGNPTTRVSPLTTTPPTSVTATLISRSSQSRVVV